MCLCVVKHLYFHPFLLLRFNTIHCLVGVFSSPKLFFGANLFDCDQEALSGLGASEYMKLLATYAQCGYQPGYWYPFMAIPNPNSNLCRPLASHAAPVTMKEGWCCNNSKREEAILLLSSMLLLSCDLYLSPSPLQKKKSNI